VSKLALAAPFLMTKLLVRSVRILVVYPCYRWLCARARNFQIVAMVAELSADHLRAAYYDRGCFDGQMATGVILGVAVQTLLAYDHARSRPWSGRCRPRSC
jgi:hypothetical protein